MHSRKGVGPIILLASAVFFHLTHSIQATSLNEKQFFIQESSERLVLFKRLHQAVKKKNSSLTTQKQAKDAYIPTEKMGFNKFSRFEEIIKAYKENKPIDLKELNGLEKNIRNIIKKEFINKIDISFILEPHSLEESWALYQAQEDKASWKPYAERCQIFTDRKNMNDFDVISVFEQEEPQESAIFPNIKAPPLPSTKEKSPVAPALPLSQAVHHPVSTTKPLYMQKTEELKEDDLQDWTNIVEDDGNEWTQLPSNDNNDDDWEEITPLSSLEKENQSPSPFTTENNAEKRKPTKSLWSKLFLG